MLKKTTGTLVLLLLALATLGAIFLIGMRSKSPRVQGTVRQVNRRVFNPMQMKSAGTPGAYASIVRHVGRTSGTPYETPIGAVATDDGFVIALPYGTSADWLKNVMAAGSATIVNEGETHEVDRPEIVPIAVVAEVFSPDDQRAHSIFGVDEALQVRRVV